MVKVYRTFNALVWFKIIYMKAMKFMRLFYRDCFRIRFERDRSKYLGLSTLLLTFFCIGALGLALEVGWHDGGSEVPPKTFILVWEKDSHRCELLLHMNAKCIYESVLLLCANDFVNCTCNVDLLLSTTDLSDSVTIIIFHLAQLNKNRHLQVQFYFRC